MFYMMKALRDTILNFEGSAYEERVAQKKETYDYISSLMKQYI